MKKTKIVISLDKGMIWPVIKVCDHADLEVIVINNDRSSIWKPEIEYNCDEEIEQLSELADELKLIVNEVGESINK